MNQAAGPACSTGSHKLNDGWLTVERSMHHRIDRSETEHYQKFPGGWLEVGKYGWTQPIETVWSTERRCYLVSLSIAGHETSVVTNLKTGQCARLESSGRLFLVPPGQTIQCQSLKGQVRSMRCMLEASLVESFLDTMPMWDWLRVPLQEAMHLGGGQIEWLMRRMYREISDPDFATAPVVESLARQLAVEILRKFRPHGVDQRCFVGGLSARHRRLIRERLYAPQPLPILRELADLCCMTVRHLTRAYRTDTGHTLGKYIDTVMVERAKALLTAGATVQEVAACFGYAGSSSFRSAFRRATGLTPSEVKAS
jgi:AraC family transcriptional regulator